MSVSFFRHSVSRKKVLDRDVETTVHKTGSDIRPFSSSSCDDLGYTSRSFIDILSVFFYTEKHVASPSAIAELFVRKCPVRFVAYNYIVNIFSDFDSKSLTNTLLAQCTESECLFHGEGAVRAEYCDTARLCACLSAKTCISQEPRVQTSPNFLMIHDVRGRSSVFIGRRCDTLRTSGFLDDVVWRRSATG